MYKKIAVIALMVLLSACSKTPMQKLQSNTLFDDMTPSYWAKQQGQNTELWTQAMTYCKQHTEKPNCGAVMQIYIFSNGATTAPAIGHSGHSLVLPKIE